MIYINDIVKPLLIMIGASIFFYFFVLKMSKEWKSPKGCMFNCS